MNLYPYEKGKRGRGNVFSHAEGVGVLGTTSFGVVFTFEVLAILKEGRGCKRFPLFKTKRGDEKSFTLSCGGGGGGVRGRIKVQTRNFPISPPPLPVINDRSLEGVWIKARPHCPTMELG